MEQTIYLGAGCFWCVEAVFRNIRGVDSVESGYANGYHSKIPNYRQISTNSTGYAEVVRVQYDDTVISTEHLIEIFFGTHDSTTLNQQGADIGTQYRSAIFYTTLEQNKIANKTAKQTRTIKIIMKKIAMRPIAIRSSSPSSKNSESVSPIMPNKWAQG